MLCDTPTNYEREQPCVDIITSLPDTFDETKIIQGKLGSYIIVARRNGSDWYLGGQTNWDGRDVELSLDILPRHVPSYHRQRRHQRQPQR